MDELISRQAAIDTLRMDIDIIPFAKAREYARAVIETVYNRLEELPSAQPEIKCIAKITLTDEQVKEAVEKAKCEILTALPEQRWIPVTERLPDMHDEVLVTARGEVSIAWLYVDGKWRSNDMPQSMFKDITAWMPLPEPFREGGET